MYIIQVLPPTSSGMNLNGNLLEKIGSPTSPRNPQQAAILLRPNNNNSTVENTEIQSLSIQVSLC